MTDSQALLRLLQLVSPALPVGAYSYSEGLETLIDQGAIAPASLLSWLEQELAWGLVRAETTLLYRLHGAATEQRWADLAQDNRWLSAFRESEESRQQSWAMGRAILRLIQDLHPDLAAPLAGLDHPCNFVVGFAALAAHWHIPAQITALGYLHSWAANLITGAVKLVPLGQTQGQRLLMQLYPTLEATVLETTEADLGAVALGGWGASLASMQHEALYSRLFRS